MRLALLLFVFLVVLATFVDAGKKKKMKMNKGNKNRGGGMRNHGAQRDKAGRDCAGWVWGDCEPTEGECGVGTKKATRDGADCKVISKTKRCRIPCEGDKRRKECKYAVEEISDCDETTGTRTATLRLKKGDPETCVEEKSVTKKCKGMKGKKACRYNHGQWGLCDTMTNTRVRLDILIESESDPDIACAAERVVVKKCGFACKYAFEEWSACDETARTRSRAGVLSRKKGITPADCLENVTQTRNCYNKKGVEKCFFGPWENFGKCADGKRTKSRPLLAGGERCAKKASITRNCK